MPLIRRAFLAALPAGAGGTCQNGDAGARARFGEIPRAADITLE